MLTVVILTFIAVFLVLSSVFLGFRAARQSPAAELKRRLRLMERDAKWHNLSDDLRTEIVKETPPFERFIAHIPVLRNTEKWLDQAGLKITSAQFLLLTLALSFSGFTVAFILRRNYLLSLIVALVLLAVPFIYLYVLKQRRIDRFTEQLPDVLTMVARSLRAGHAFSSALELVGARNARARRRAVQDRLRAAETRFADNGHPDKHDRTDRKCGPPFLRHRHQHQYRGGGQPG